MESNAEAASLKIDDGLFRELEQTRSTSG